MQRSNRIAYTIVLAMLDSRVPTAYLYETDDTEKAFLVNFGDDGGAVLFHDCVSS